MLLVITTVACPVSQYVTFVHPAKAVGRRCYSPGTFVGVLKIGQRRGPTMG